MLLNKNIKMIQKQLFSKISVVVKPVTEKVIYKLFILIIKIC